MDTPTHRLQVVLRGDPGGDRYGEKIAELDVPIDASRGWLIYQRAVHDAVAPDVVVLPPEVSPDEAARIRAELTKRRGGAIA